MASYGKEIHCNLLTGTEHQQQQETCETLTMFLATHYELVMAYFRLLHRKKLY